MLKLELIEVKFERIQTLEQYELAGDIGITHLT